MADPAVNDGRKRRMMAVLTVVVVLSAIAAAFFVLGGEDEASAGEVFLEAASTATADPFTDSVAAATTTTVVRASTTVAPTSTSPRPAEPTGVSGSTPGLYGGTRNRATCDPVQLVEFLAANEAKGAAWAEVIGIRPSEISDYVSGLTPVVLRRDTRVTNHGFRNGKATTLQSVLQAGTAVLVDDAGVPRVKCECGNPLGEPGPISSSAAYAGRPWSGFSTTTVVTVNVTVHVEQLVLIDTDTQLPFSRPVGTTGDADQDAPDGACARFPKDPGCTSSTVTSTTPTTSAPTTMTTTTTTTTTTTGEPVMLLEITSIAGVSNGPSVPSVLTLDEPALIQEIQTYHWNDAQGSTPGTVALRSEDGEVYGPWPTVGTPGQGGVPNAYWTATPNVTLPAGTYTVVDSEPSTWAYAPDTAGQGIVWIRGYLTAGEG